LSTGTTFKAISTDTLSFLKVFLPEEHTQIKIAAFLDKETGIIDKMIEKKSRFIELLKEKRQALITKAVTKGINPDVKMKDSGVEWLGKVPEEWEVKKLKHLAAINMGQSPKSEDCEEYNEENPFLQGNAEFTSISPEPKLSCLNAPKKCSKGDILISVRAPVGEINIADQTYGIGRGLCALKGIKVKQRFLYYFMKYSNEILNVLSTGTTFKAISTDTLSFLKVFLPEEHTQIKIAAFLDRETALIDSLISKTEESISLLKEKRSALITAAVTGKIDVREEA
jgi:type I restriction enzyme S subunit